MAKGYSILLMLAVVSFTLGAGLSHSDALLAEIFGLLGLLISVICAFIFFMLKGIEELEARERGYDQEW